MKAIIPLVTLAFAGLVSAAVINEKCPVSGEPVSEDYVLEVNSKSVRFCCENCADTYKAKLNITENEVGLCPISGKPGLVENSLLHVRTRLVEFSSEKIEKEFIEKSHFSLIDLGPGVCPMSGKPAIAESFLNHNGERIYFCCENCPKSYIGRIGAVSDTPGKCVVTGEDAEAGRMMLVTSTEAVHFCCENCPDAYRKKHFAGKN